jgi:hypothetical protein
MTANDFLGTHDANTLEHYRQRLVIRNERLKQANNDKAKSWLRKSVFETKKVIKILENEQS